MNLLSDNALIQEAPSEYIVATIVAISVFLVAPHLVPFSWRLPRRLVRQIIVIIGAVSVLIITVFASGSVRVFDQLHPRRLFILHSEDVRGRLLSQLVGAS